ncbi:MAG: very short patch repair endonuclease [Candidatus Auribacterota bacterium]
MTDVFNSNMRSSIMRSVKSKGNISTEQKLIKLFRKHNLTGWRRNYKLYGKPDFVFPKKKIAIFADGCFWHGHECRNTKPENNKKYWEDKIIRNKARDELVNHTLEVKRWIVVRIWECNIKKEQIPLELIKLIQS